MTCKICSSPLGRRNTTGLCRKHATLVMQSPEIRERRREALRRYAKANRAKLAAVVIENHRKARENPEFMERLRNHMRDLQRRSQSPEALARRDRKAAGRKGSATKLAWCPPEYRAEYRRLIVSKRMHKADAVKVIEAKIAADAKAEAERIANLSPFERQMRALERGAKLVPAYTRPSLTNPANYGERKWA